MNRDSCETCALAFSIPQVNKEDDAFGEKIYAEFLRRNKKSNRIADVGGQDAATLFCVLGSRHFKNGGSKCRSWIPRLRPITIGDALSMHLNRKIAWLTRIIVALTVAVIGLMVYPILKKPHYTIDVRTQSVPTNHSEIRKKQPKENIKSETSNKTNEKPVNNIEQPKPKTVIPKFKKHKKPPEPTNHPVQQTP